MATSWDCNRCPLVDIPRFLYVCPNKLCNSFYNVTPFPDPAPGSDLIVVIPSNAKSDGGPSELELVIDAIARATLFAAPYECTVSTDSNTSAPNILSDRVISLVPEAQSVKYVARPAKFTAFDFMMSSVRNGWSNLAATPAVNDLLTNQLRFILQNGTAAHIRSLLIDGFAHCTAVQQRVVQSIYAVLNGSSHLPAILSDAFTHAKRAALTAAAALTGLSTTDDHLTNCCAMFVERRAAWPLWAPRRRGYGYTPSPRRSSHHAVVPTASPHATPSPSIMHRLARSFVQHRASGTPDTDDGSDFVAWVAPHPSRACATATPSGAVAAAALAALQGVGLRANGRTAALHPADSGDEPEGALVAPHGRAGGGPRHAQPYGPDGPDGGHGPYGPQGLPAHEGLLGPDGPYSPLGPYVAHGGPGSSDPRAAAHEDPHAPHAQGYAPHAHVGASGRGSGDESAHGWAGGHSGDAAALAPVQASALVPASAPAGALDGGYGGGYRAHDDTTPRTSLTATPSRARYPPAHAPAPPSRTVPFAVPGPHTAAPMSPPASPGFIIPTASFTTADDDVDGSSGAVDLHRSPRQSPRGSPRGPGYICIRGGAARVHAYEPHAAARDPHARRGGDATSPRSARAAAQVAALGALLSPHGSPRAAAAAAGVPAAVAAHHPLTPQTPARRAVPVFDAANGRPAVCGVAALPAFTLAVSDAHAATRHGDTVGAVSRTLVSAFLHTYRAEVASIVDTLAAMFAPDTVAARLSAPPADRSAASGTITSAVVLDWVASRLPTRDVPPAMAAVVARFTTAARPIPQSPRGSPTGYAAPIPPSVPLFPCPARSAAAASVQPRGRPPPLSNAAPPPDSAAGAARSSAFASPSPRSCTGRAPTRLQWTLAAPPAAPHPLAVPCPTHPPAYDTVGGPYIGRHAAAVWAGDDDGHRGVDDDGHDPTGPCSAAVALLEAPDAYGPAVRPPPEALVAHACLDEDTMAALSLDRPKAAALLLAVVGGGIGWADAVARTDRGNEAATRHADSAGGAGGPHDPHYANTAQGHDVRDPDGLGGDDADAVNAP